MRSKLLIANNYPVIREGLLSIIKKSKLTLQSIHIVDNLNELHNSLGIYYPDILILDFDLNGISGTQSIREIKNKYKGVKILVFSGHSDDVFAVNVIKSGASGFLSKTAEIADFKTAIERISTGGIYLSEELSKQLSENTLFLKTKSQNILKKLSNRESEVLSLLTEGKKNKDIAINLGISEKTVSTYKSRVFDKMDVNNLVDLVKRYNYLKQVI